jgi:CubicO group peptidase (beta-lactamase class C family)
MRCGRLQEQEGGLLSVMGFLFCHVFVFLLLAAPGFGLPTSTPEAEGIASSAILEFINAAEAEVDALHSFVLLRHGKVVSEGWWAPYARSKPHMLYSLSKSFTATAVGMAIDEGHFGLDDKVLSFFPDKLSAEPTENLRAMRIRDLLRMGSGHAHDTLSAMRSNPDADWVRLFLQQDVAHAPGSFFRYNTGATYMLSAILQSVTGERLLDYLQPRLFAPLEIEASNWERCAQGIDTGGYGLKLRTREIAALGQLYLQRGSWAGRQLVSEEWVAQASSKQIANGAEPSESDWKQGYGFQFWRCQHNAYRADGAFGQFCIVMPDQDAVLAITSGLRGMQAVLKLVWKHLMPAMSPEVLAADAAAYRALAAKTGALQLKLVTGAAQKPVGDGVLGRTYYFAENAKGLKSLRIAPSWDGHTLRIANAHGWQEIHCGLKSWKGSAIVWEKELKLPVAGTNGKQPVSSSGAWTSEGHFLARVYFNETPFRLDMTLDFSDGGLALSLDYNVSFGRRNWQLSGK